MTNLPDLDERPRTGGSNPLLSTELHTPRSRALQVARVETLGPTMRRIVLTGDDLETDFPWRHLAVADHVKLVFPDPFTGDLVLPQAGPDGRRGDLAGLREYTVRHVDPVLRELTLDFVVHEHGPAGRWAAHAKPGAALGVLGPRGSRSYPADRIAYLLVADETGLPAVERFCEELPPFAPVHVIAFVEHDTKRILSHADRADIRWIQTSGHVVGDVVRAVAHMPLVHGTFVWGGGEASVMRAVRDHLLAERHFDRDHVDVRGYWRQGAAGSGDERRPG